MVDINHIRDTIIRPALDSVSLYSPEAENLILFTGFIESEYQYLKQIKGPAKGFWQIEPRTHVDIKKFLSKSANKLLKERILSTCYLDILPDDDALIWNLRYGCIICRLVYYRYSAPIPETWDSDAMSNYHKRYYNGGALGKANVEENARKYKTLFNLG